MKWKTAAAAAVACAVLFGAAAPPALRAAEDHTSRFRVYQNDSALREFSSRTAAIAYAQGFRNAYVEQIGTRSWVWDNYPQYKVYQNGNSVPQWEFHTFEAAVAEAKKWANASVRKLSDGGWAWDNYPDHPGYTLYQGEKTLPEWTFSTVEKARAEAAKWANAHIIDNATNKWVWDNLSADRKTELRSGTPIYRVYQGTTSLADWSFAYLEDAVNESLKWADSIVVNTTKQNTIVFRNIHSYIVTQNGGKKSSFVSLTPAVQYASRLENASVFEDGKRLWTNEPYYEVYQSGREIASFPAPGQAAAYAVNYADARVVTLDGTAVWDNLKDLLYMAWNGSANHDIVVGHVSPTQGLDIDSPTWFYLQDAAGTLKDESDPATVSWLKTQGVKVHPLVHNQFNAKLTSAFLADPEAQNRFIASLVARLVELGADGVNLDFESLAGSDRDKFTAFVKALGEAARARGLTVSIDLPRGSVAWNHQTAFDHEKLHQYVDYIAIMAYDQFYSGSSSAGPVSGLSWAEQGVREFLSYGIPRSKLLLGVPFYIRVWEFDSAGRMVANRAVFMKDLARLLEGAQVQTSADAQYGLDKVLFMKDGTQYLLWKEDIASAVERIAIAKKYDLAGIAAWRLGYEPAELWTELLRAK